MRICITERASSQQQSNEDSECKGREEGRNLRLLEGAGGGGGGESLMRYRAMYHKMEGISHAIREGGR